MAEKDLMTHDDKDIAIFDDDLFLDEGTGLEEATADDFATPLIRILQPQNPQQMEASDKYIPGAKAGMFWNNVTGAIYSGETGLRIVPCQFEKRYIEWIPVDQGGGMVERHLDASILKQCTQGEKGDYFLPDGHEIVETGQYYALLVPEDGSETEPAIIPFAKTNLKVSKQWNSMLRSTKIRTSQGVRLAPIYAYTYLLTTEIRQKDQYVWYNSVLNRVGPTDPDLIRVAQAFRDVVKRGEVIVRQDATETVDSDLPDAF